MSKLRLFDGVPTPIAFRDGSGTPLVIDFNTGIAYFFNPKTLVVAPLAGTTGSSGALSVRSVSTAYTFVAADENQAVTHPSADTTARIWTIPANSSVAFAVGAIITVDNQAGAGALSLAITTDTLEMIGTGGTGTRTLAPSGQATLLKIDTTKWRVSGIGLS